MFSTSKRRILRLCIVWTEAAKAQLPNGQFRFDFFDSSALVGVKPSVTGKQVYAKELYKPTRVTGGETLSETYLSDEEHHEEAQHVKRGLDQSTKDQSQ